MYILTSMLHVSIGAERMDDSSFFAFLCVCTHMRGWILVTHYDTYLLGTHQINSCVQCGGGGGGDVMLTNSLSQHMTI